MEKEGRGTVQLISGYRNLDTAVHTDIGYWISNCIFCHVSVQYSFSLSILVARSIYSKFSLFIHIGE